ncbi:cytochrome-c peroxidase [Puniceibacterium sediminis]|uniref:Cytochrome c peroxidase n=1 Tax=Puniceibacterium sediminis TaxID=1608407 RepID=A0A238VG15_9RHOB|nr:cytochrome c peroxidase [Puniceibacterium sediminis]SNR32459.1 cytochrome c peroxidase [Puniceibacterium sediminis]
MRNGIAAIFVSLALVPEVWAQEIPAPITDAAYAPVDPAEAALGQLLFYDSILSGNREVSCATCHHPRFGTGDGLSLSLGDGGIGLGPDRRADPANPPEARVPRNAPALFNLGAHEFTRLFDDGRIEVDPARPGGFRTPLDDDMVVGFASLLSAQTMFPVVSADEMAGHVQENDVSRAVRQGLITGPGGAWDMIARRVAAVPGYADRFPQIYPHITGPDDIAFTDISNAIAAFMELEWRSDTSPFDAYLRGESTLPTTANKGMELFYGRAECSTCHSGPFQTDHGFHAMGAPQIGPGKAAKFESHFRDEGRYRVTGKEEDLYAFRTPSLRNIALTAPYGHAGGHADLAGFIASHADPAAGLRDYDITQAVLPNLPFDDGLLMADAEEVAAISATATWSVPLSDDDIANLVAFLGTLTDSAAMKGRLGVPESLPSGLPVAR